MRSPTELRVHIGAHKTASKHLQDSLAMQRAALAQQGVDYIPGTEVQHRLLSKLLRRSGWRQLVPGRYFDRRWQAALTAVRLGPDVVVISDETILGRPKHVLDGPFYPQIRLRLGALASAAESMPLQLFVSIRGPDSLIPSAYVQALRAGRWPGGFDRIRRNCVSNPPSWTDLIRRIRAAFPALDVKVWTFETYCIHDTKIMAAFCGVPAVQDFGLSPPARTMTPSSNAVAKIEALDRRLRGRAYRLAVQEICRCDAGTEKYRPFSDHERSILAEAYEEDLHRMEAAFPGLLMKIGNADDHLSSPREHAQITSDPTSRGLQG